MNEHLKTLKSMVRIMNPSAVKNEIFNGVPSIRRRTKRKASTKPRKHDEQNLSHLIQEDLKLLELRRNIVHWDRYNSGTVQSISGYWIKLCRKGTADLAFMLSGRMTVYIETKARTKQEDCQIEFQHKVERAGHKYYIVKSWKEWVDVKAKHIVEEVFILDD